jgi:DNA primase
MAFPPSFLEELRRRIALSGVVGRRVRLAKKGREFEGLCPFHNEKSPSFFVNDEKAFYHCFGCGAHGDVIGFVMNTEGLSFPETVERLAGEAGLDVPRESRESPEQRDHLATLYEATQAASEYFQEELKKPAGRLGLEYLKKRGLDEADIARFKLGFAPDNRNGLKAYLTKRSVSEAVAVETGLLIRAEDKPESFDRFRGRVMFPIADKRGRVIAFGGRIIGDGQPKYLNSPETPLFHKGRVLFAHHLAREAASKSGSVIVNEGYMDVVALHKAGFVNAVAPLGTALTEEQLGELWRLAPEPLLCFDGDSAGQRAAGRAAERALPLLEPGKSLRFVTLPPGQDPDDVVRQPGGVMLLRKLLEDARPLVDIVWELELNAGPHDTPERRADLRRRLRERVFEIRDQDVREFYKRDLDERQRAMFGGPPSAMPQRANRADRPRNGKRPWNEPDPYVKQRPANLQAEQVNASSHARALLAAFLNHPELADEYQERLAQMSFGEERLDSLRHEIVNTFARAPGLDAAALQTYLAEGGYSPIMTQILHRDVYRVFPFASPEADFAAVLASCQALFSLIDRRHEQVDRQAVELAATDGTPESWARLQAVLRKTDEACAEPEEF